MGGSLIAGAITVGLLGGARGVAAEELREQLNAPMILKLLARPAEAPDTALKEMLNRDTTPALRSPAEWETLPDGSARHVGTGITVTVRNPCPPGDLAHEAAQLRALPGRRR
ncbi:MAG TPA: hypothetical protein VFO18_19710 [Methylomirabilota bacterium]|nr:hypothetical protein [Methylomirabilota bacterium]